MWCYFCITFSMRKLGIVVLRANRPGRPATGTDPVVTLRLPQAMIDTLDIIAGAEGATRSDIIRDLIEVGLSARTPKLRARK